MLLDIAQNRPREQDFDAWRTSAEVKAGSARFFIGTFYGSRGEWNHGDLGNGHFFK